MYLIFTGVGILGNLVLRRGYPLEREMLPFYPVIVFMITSAFEMVKTKFVKIPLVLTASLLCLQFVLRIDLNATSDWRDNYRIRSEIFTYITSHAIPRTNSAADREAEEIVAGYENPAADFYSQKYITCSFTAGY
jgi:hypothetical protein